MPRAATLQSLRLGHLGASCCVELDVRDGNTQDPGSLNLWMRTRFARAHSSPSVSALFKLRAGVVSFLASPPRPCARRASRTNACAWRRELSPGVAVNDRAAVVDQREVELGGDLPRLEVRSPRPGETRACTRTICRSSRRRPRCARGRRRRRRACRRSRKAPSCTGFFVYSGAFRNLVRLAQQRLRVGALVLVAELLVAKMKSWGSPELNSCAPGGTASAASRVTI